MACCEEIKKPAESILNVPADHIDIGHIHLGLHAVRVIPCSLAHSTHI